MMIKKADGAPSAFLLLQRIWFYDILKIRKSKRGDRMKKVISVLLILVSIFLISSCGAAAPENKSTIELPPPFQSE